MILECALLVYMRSSSCWRVVVDDRYRRLIRYVRYASEMPYDSYKIEALLLAMWVVEMLIYDSMIDMDHSVFPLFRKLEPHGVRSFVPDQCGTIPSFSWNIL